MSTYKIGLKVPDKSTLKNAVRELAKKMSLEVLDSHVKDFYGNETRVDVGLKGIGLGNGIGFTRDADGNVNIVGDEYNQARYREIGEIGKNWINGFQAMQRAKSNNPFATTNLKIEQRKVVLECVLP